MNYKYNFMSKHIKSGDYFRDGLEWHFDQYASPYFHRMFILITFLSVFFLMIDLLLSTMNIYQVEVYPFPLYVEDATNKYRQIIKIGGILEPVNVSVAKYFLNRYVTLRESYDPNNAEDDRWKVDWNKIKVLSSRSVYNKFLEEVEPEQNINSPILRYKNHTSRLIKIDKIEFSNAMLAVPSIAKIYFTATEKTQNQSIPTKFIAFVSFSMSNIERLVDEKTKLQFMITKYRSEELIKDSKTIDETR